MKLINVLRSLNRYFALGIVAMLAVSVGIAFSQTQVITGPCSATTSTLGQNVTLTGICTGTVTLSSSTTTTNQQLIGHAFNPSCAAINIPTSVTYFQTNFSSVNRTWAMYTQVHDRIHNYTLLAGFTTIHGNHNFTETFITPSLTMTAEIPIADGNGATRFGQQRPLNSNVIAGDNLDVYANANAVQMIWYINNTQGIENELNLPPYPVDNFIPTDMTTYFTGQINGLHTHRQLGNQFQTQQSPLEVSVTLAYDSPCGINPITSTNVIDTFGPNNSMNNGTIVTEDSG